jgi:hypothetical protein
MSKKIRTSLSLKNYSNEDRVFILQCLQNGVINKKRAKRILFLETVV